MSADIYNKNKFALKFNNLNFYVTTIPLLIKVLKSSKTRWRLEEISQAFYYIAIDIIDRIDWKKNYCTKGDNLKNFEGRILIYCTP